MIPLQVILGAYSLSRRASEQKRKNSEIENQLLIDKQDARREIKILLLGTREAGKSTFLKQMRIIHGSGYSQEDKRRFIIPVYKNIFMVMQSIIRAMKLLKIQYADMANIKKAELVTGVDCQTVTSLESVHVVTAIKDLWSDAGIQDCFDRRREYNLADSAGYFLNGLDRIRAPDYLPTEQDILRARVPTNGVVEYKFELDSVIFRMMEVGAKRSGRRKWIHSFENVQAVFFFVALNEYDQQLFASSSSSSNENGMKKSMALFQAIVTSPWFQHSSIILFWNKNDIFEHKIMSSDLVENFPGYKGPPGDPVQAREFILQRYRELNPDDYKKIYGHYTVAIDPGSIRDVFGKLKNAILLRNLEDYKLD